jgi:hypothetical protein
MVNQMNQKTNDELAAEYEQKIREDDEAKLAKGKIFDPYQLLERASKIHEADHPTLGKLRYGELTFEDAFEINKCKTDAQKTETIAYLMLKKAYPDIPCDFLKQMPLLESAALIDFLTKQPAFLSPTKNSQNGSKTTSKPKRSV